MTVKLRISKAYGGFVVDEPLRPGAPPVGQGKTMEAALGSWLHNNRDRVGVEIEVAPTAQTAENARQKRELAKR